MALLWLSVVLLLQSWAGRSSASTTSGCINITLNNVFDIGDCLGGNADYCTDPSIPITEALTKLVGCTLKGVAENGSPEEIGNSISGLVAILLNSLGLDFLVKNIPSSGHWDANRVCQDPIHLNIGDVGLLGECVDDLAVLCQAGTLAEDTTYEELFETLRCFLKALSKQDLVTITAGVVCDISALAEQADFGIDILTFLVRALTGVVTNVTC
ncbi:uncharacterized protein LOC142589072 [Dermacentor variabilis]|uniref:uncharacterized protein LOC142589072 n=1 Tax=Dermacentor variabilis TaxID=34621 RepID=UPI003F5BF5C8